MEQDLLDERKLNPETREFYSKVLNALRVSRIPFLVGGAYAIGCYTGIIRDTKDFDVFVHPRDVMGILDVLAHTGYKTELTDNIWLGKAFNGEDLVDVVFSSANGIAEVDDEWFEHAPEGSFFDFPLRLVPPEEMIWSKSFVMTRDRYDGADIAHIILSCADRMDWYRVLRRFNPHWRILYNYLVLFGYIYPSERTRIPRWIMRELADRMGKEVDAAPPDDRVCRGTLLSTTQYVIDVEQWGFRDPRPVRNP